ncbi:MAG: glycosyltransferase family 9 protein, partial [Acidobacteriota bacterium]
GLTVPPSPTMTPEVNCVRTLEEVEAIERRYIAPLPIWLVAWVRLRTLIANLVVRVFRLLWFRKPAPLGSLRRVVVYAFGTLGDHLVALPALAALRKACPNAKITLLSSTGGIGPRVLDELLGDQRLVDAMVFVPDPPTRRRGFHVDYDPALEGLKGCDLFVNLSPFGNRGLTNAVFRELFIARHVRARSAVGFKVKGWAGTKNLKRVLHLFVGNEPRRCGEVLAELGLVPAEPGEAVPRFPEAKARLLGNLDALQGDGPLVVLNPGSKFQVQRWPVDRFALVAQQIQAEGRAKIVAVGTGGERAVCERALSGSHGLNLAGSTDLQELAELLRVAALCLTNDTGTMHLAAMVGCSTVALFTTRLSPRHWFPLGSRVAVLLAFTKDHYDYRDEGEAHDSLLAISTERVTKIAIETLQARTPSRPTDGAP